MPRFFWPLISVTSFRFDVPDVDTSVLPLRSSSLFRLADFLDTKRLAVTKVIMSVCRRKETCCWRSVLFVVEPHSRSIVPLAISGMRVADVTGTVSTVRFGSFSSVLTASTIFMQRSIE